MFFKAMLIQMKACRKYCLIWRLVVLKKTLLSSLFIFPFFFPPAGPGNTASAHQSTTIYSPS